MNECPLSSSGLGKIIFDIFNFLKVEVWQKTQYPQQGLKNKMSNMWGSMNECIMVLLRASINSDSLVFNMTLQHEVINSEVFTCAYFEL